MITVKRLTTINEVKDLLFEQVRSEGSGHLRSPYFYRGMPNADYHLQTSLKRNCGEKAGKLEKPMLENFIKYVIIEEPTIDESIWKAMIIGQHHGLPTRLLDWTPSTLVALHFANAESNWEKLDQHDCAVWRIDAKELMSKLPEKYQKVLTEKHSFIFSVESLAEIAGDLKQYDDDMGDRSLVTVEPPSIDLRIVNQYSFFTILPAGIEDLEQYLDENTEHTVKYIIGKELRWDLRDILDQLNMNERMIYPGKDGIAKWIARHYFVRREE